ncbi:MAG: helix-turn-helix transcriptional regulator, partial [Clostridia bacterium]
MMGDRIKRARKRLGMTQGTLGFEVGIGKSSISEWESGKRSPPIDKMQDIARTLKTSVAYLMGWVGDPDDMSHISRSEPLPFY